MSRVMKRNGFKWLFAVYLILVFLAVIVKFDGTVDSLLVPRADFGAAYNLKLFHSIRMQIVHIHSRWGRLNLFGNLLPFIPYGILLPCAFPGMRRGGRTILAGFLFSLFCELFQLFTRLGTFDVDDILLNTVGVCAGWLIFRRVCRNGRPDD